VIHVLLVGDVRLSREGIAELLRRDGRVHVTTTSTSADRVVTKVRDVDVVVIDTAGGHGVSSASIIGEARETPVLVFGVCDGDDTVIGLAEAGAIGFVECESDVDELVAGIQAAARREAWCSPPIATMLLERIRTLSAGRVTSRDPSKLTAREHQIVELIADGLTNKEIARRLYIEVSTVKNHVHNILDKLHVRRRADAAAHLRVVEGMSFERPDDEPGSRGQSGVA
jgi:two-component system nitrate/nitrite response regulator NarL